MVESTGTMTEIDFDTLNRELEEGAAQRNTDGTPPLSFDLVFQKMQKEAIQDYMDRANEAKKIDYYFDLDCTGPTLFMRRLIRRINKFLFFKNFQRQADYNSYLLQINRMLFKHILTTEEEHEKDRRTIQALEEKVRILEQMAEMEEKR
ncbi:MAG: hypothetical protein K6G18_11245 [Treponema sp.]|nr:hypothetical protein [Treponema sp.]